MIVGSAINKVGKSCPNGLLESEGCRHGGMSLLPGDPLSQSSVCCGNTSLSASPLYFATRPFDKERQINVAVTFLCSFVVNAILTFNIRHR